MLLDFKINNYKNINKEMVLNLDTNLFFICGGENSGKTSIIDSIVFAISHMISPAQYILKEKIPFYKNMLLNYKCNNKKCEFNIRIKLNGITYNYALGLKNDELNNIIIDSEYLDIDEQILFKRNEKNVQLSDIVKRYEIEKYIDDGIPLFSSIVISKKNDTINNLYEHLKNMVVVDSSLNSLIVNDNNISLLEKEKKNVLGILKRFNKNYKNFIIKGKDITSIYENENKVDFINESTTIQNILLYMPSIITAIKNGSIIVIDDIDRRFNMKFINIIKELILNKNINKNNAQLITAVSSKEFIEESKKCLCI